MRDRYFKGEVVEVAEQIGACKDSDPLFFNYVDSLCYGRRADFVHTGRALLESLSPEQREVLEWEQVLYYIIQSNETELNQILQDLKRNPQQDPFLLTVIHAKQSGKIQTIANYPFLSKYSQEKILAHVVSKAEGVLPRVAQESGLKGRLERLGPGRYLATYLKDYIDGLAENRVQTEEDLRPLRELYPSPPRRTRGVGKLRVAHVLTQLLDGRHAPSRLVSSFVEHHDRAKIEPFLFITEAYVDRPEEYPVTSAVAQPSPEAGLARATAAHCPVIYGKGTLADTVRGMIQALSDHRIDVAIFHEADPINLAIAWGCDVPQKVYYQQARALVQPGFDLWMRVLQGSMEHRQWAESIGTEIAVVSLPLEHERVAAAPRPCLEEERMLTTVSNYLESRLTSQCVGTIARILQRVPSAVYAPIGRIDRVDQFIERFAAHGVADQVKPLGVVPNPCAYAPHAALYLNEFPIGSGLGIVDMLSAGCPVVSMYDPNGPDMGKGGAVYFGEEWCVRSMDDYVDTACRLLEDEKLYAEWRSHARTQYEALTNTEACVRQTEQVLLGRFVQ